MMYIYTCVFAVTTPHIIHDPESQTIELSINNYNFSLYCEAEGALSYYWRIQLYLVSMPLNIIGVNTTNLTLINVQPGYAGRYQCVASNASGSSNSTPANIVIHG